MTPDEATAVLDHLQTLWPSPSWTATRVSLWRDVLAELHPGAAATTVDRLARTTNRCPSLVAFRTECMKAAARLGEQAPRCERCDGTRYVEALLDDVRHGPGCTRPTGADDCTCSAVIPCPECARP